MQELNLDDIPRHLRRHIDPIIGKWYGDSVGVTRMAESYTQDPQWNNIDADVDKAIAALHLYHQTSSSQERVLMYMHELTEALAELEGSMETDCTAVDQQNILINLPEHTVGFNCRKCNGRKKAKRSLCGQPCKRELL